jgi:hypothetical protein
MLASLPASMVNQRSTDLGIPNRFRVKSSRFSPAIPATESTGRHEIRIDDRDRISISDPRRAFQAHRGRFIAAAVLLILGCMGAWGSLYFSGRTQVTEQNAKAFTPIHTGMDGAECR